MKFILASASPRRKQLLLQIGLEFSSLIPEVDETPMQGEKPLQLVQRLARAKANAVAAPPGSIVIAADTIVECKGKILGKPGSDVRAIEMLQLLSGRAHRVITGMALSIYQDKVTSLSVTSTKVFFRKLDHREIINYVRRDSVRNCAGAYRIQNRGVFFIEKIVGSYSNVVGLPLETLYSECGKLGIDLL